MKETESHKIFFNEGFNPLHDVSPEQLDKYLFLIRDRKFILSETGISPRVFNLWKKLELIDIPQLKETRPSIKLNFSDYIWLKLVSDLRCFGCSLVDIKAIKEMCYSTDKLEFINKEEILGLIMENIKSKKAHTPAELEIIEKNLKVMDWQKEANEIVGKPLNKIETFILLMLFNKSDSNLLVFINKEFENAVDVIERKKTKRQAGLFAVFTNDEIEERLSDDDRQKVYKLPRIKLPLKIYLDEFILDFENTEHALRIKLLNKEEVNLLNEVRRGDVDEIKIVFKNKKIERLEVKKEIKKNVETRLIETFRKGEYAELTYKVENGKLIGFKKTTKYKFNK